MKLSRYLPLIVAVVATANLIANAGAEDSSANIPLAAETVVLPPVIVRWASDVAPVFPPNIEQAKIFAGKKATVANLQAIPPVSNNNYRQALALLPGVLVSEMQTAGHVNINYRGLGDPHETEFLLTLKDGIPIVSEWIGFSMLYFSPPLEAVDHVQLIRGGSALLYGPQPGPALNLVTHLPPSDRAFTARTQHSAGSYGLFSTYNEISGTVEDLGYLALFHHRQADGPRDNADYYVYSGNFKLVLDPNEHTRWIIALDAYSNENGEPGRMNLATYLANRNTATTPSNRLWVQRYMPSVTYQHNVSEDTLLEIKSWAGYQGRLSRRQTGANTNLDHHQIYFGGLDTRVRHYWSGWEDGQVFTGGFVLYGANRPRPREACADRHVR